MSEEKTKLEKEIIDNCILLDAKNSEISTPQSWDRVIYDVSYQLEALNLLYYPKYKIKIVADQIKEKYGTLCYYFSVIHGFPWYQEFILNILGNITATIESKVDFNSKLIKPKPDIKTYTIDFVNKKDIDNKQSHVFGNVLSCENDYVKNKDTTRITSIVSFTIPQRIAQKHKFIWMILKRLQRIIHKLSSHNKPLSNAQNVIFNYLHNEASKIVNEATHKVEDMCISCGRSFSRCQIPRCQTTKGYIAYYCESCAQKTGRPYIMENDMYNNVINTEGK